jgi:ferredoxin-NADP reductase
MRSYSVLNEDAGKNIQMVIKKIDNGRGTSFLFDKTVGDELQMLYPLGHFGLPAKLSDKLTFIGTGTGIAPLLCMLESLPEASEAEVKLIFGVRFATDLFYMDRIEKLTGTLKNFKLIVTISKPQEGWNGYKGRVSEHLQDIDPAGQFFICGSKDMIIDVKKLLEEQQVPRENIMFENFG